MLDCAHNQLSPNQRGISISTIIKTSTTVIILFISLAFASNAYAYNCSAVPQYIEGSSYSSSNIVQNEGNAYQCSIGDWCTTGGPYAPPTGWAWPNAWNDLGACDGGSSSSGGSSSGGSSSGGSSGGSSSGGSSSGGSSSGGSSSGGSSSGGESCASLPTWEQYAIYNNSDEVQYMDKKYIAKWWSQNQNPVTNSSPDQTWTLNNTCGLPQDTIAVEPNCDDLNIDADNDGIPDCAEEPGKTFYSMPLYEWGARKNQVDLFLEVDYLPIINGDHGTRPTRRALERVQEVFAANGYQAHIDIGDLFDANAGTDPTDFDLGGGQEIPYADLIDIPTLRDTWIPLHFANNPERKRIFYYSVFGHRQNGTNSSGRAPDFFDYYFFLSMGDWNLNVSTQKNINKITNFHASTLTHEWGHVLGLAHNGNPDSYDGGNNKPNYLSSMNYQYQFTGVPREYPDMTKSELILDRYQLFQSTGFNCKDRLVERRPSNNTWTSLLKGAEEDPAVFNFGFSHASESAINETSLAETSTLGGMDFTCDGIISNDVMSFDLNKTSTQDTLDDYNDWDKLYLYYRHLNYQGGVFQAAPVNLSSVISPSGLPGNTTMMMTQDQTVASQNVTDDGVIEEEIPADFLNELK